MIIFRWLLIAPFSLAVFTTLLGHSGGHIDPFSVLLESHPIGYRSHPSFVVFNPLIIPLLYTLGNQILTPGDHQVHHSHRRYNFGYADNNLNQNAVNDVFQTRLFFRFWDKYYGTYRRCEVRAKGVDHWVTTCKNMNEDDVKGKVGLDRLVETQWGF